MSIGKLKSRSQAPYKNMKKIILLLIVIVLGLIIILFVVSNIENVNKIDDNIDEEPVYDGEVVVEDIRIDNPRPNQEIESPVVLEGKARGYWFFEASFPVELVDSSGEIIAQGIATAETDWMTEEFVQFKAVLEFEKPENKKGTLILHKDNPSGLPENDDALKVPVIFK